jgi:phenylalanyl-tRNA synthetase beta chain
VIRELSRFQAVERDFSFVFPDSVSWEAVRGAIVSLGLAELQSVAPVEIFRDAKGKAVATGSYSLLTRVVFQAAERTLTEEDLSAASERIAAALVGLGGAQRA